MSNLIHQLSSSCRPLACLHKARVLSSVYCCRQYCYVPPPEHKKLYKKLKYSKIRQNTKHKNGKIFHDQRESNDEVPLIVKLMLSKDELKEEKQNEREKFAKDKETFSTAELKSHLEEIKNNFRSSILKSEALANVEVQDENLLEEVSKVLPTCDNAYLESVFLDEDILSSKIDQEQPSDRSQEIHGTSMPGTGFSNVPCSGCGAILHCEDSSLPGYMKGEKFTLKTREELYESVCQRCHLINYNNLCLNVKVGAEEYRNIISVIRNSRSLLIVMVDLLDMENSMFPNLLQSVGSKKKLFVVGNKVDLLPKDSPHYLKDVKNSLKQACLRAGLHDYGNIKHVSLISAKTGYGVENLISDLIDYWGIKDNVYLLGSANTGKSTLFNTLLASDYCKSKIRDYIKRATTSVWSGTTLNLLKFPIINPEPHRIFQRKERLLKAKQYEMDKKLEKEKMKFTENLSYSETVLKADIKTTDFRRYNTEEEGYIEESGQELVSFKGNDSGEIEAQMSEISETDGKPSLSFFYEQQFVNVRWLFDTPGVIKSEQIVNMLKDDEVLTITPKRRLTPRVFILDPGQVMFISGLSRLDYLQGDTSIFVTVFTNYTLPVFTKNLRSAEKFYTRQLQYDTFKVPLEGGNHLPPLEGHTFEIIGEGSRYSTADIQLSSLGWISVAIQRNKTITLKAYTPGGYGCHIRQPSLLPNFRSFQGERINKTNKYLYKFPVYEKQ